MRTPAAVADADDALCRLIQDAFGWLCEPGPGRRAGTGRGIATPRLRLTQRRLRAMVCVSRKCLIPKGTDATDATDAKIGMTQ